MDDITRLRLEYARRRHDSRYHNWYSPFNAANIFITQEREREIARLLAQCTDHNLSTYRVLDVGCGGGHDLAKFIGFGAAPEKLFGLDLLWDRLTGAKQRFAYLNFGCGNATMLPYRDQVFDLVLQFTVFTSILDDRLRQHIAAEMLRVLKPSGLILWYDYRLNPTNRQTRGIEKEEIKRLFPHCAYRFQRVTLAPPLARLVAPHSWFACILLNQLSFLKTHYLVAIRGKLHETAI